MSVADDTAIKNLFGGRKSIFGVRLEKRLRLTSLVYTRPRRLNRLDIFLKEQKKKKRLHY